MHVERCQESMEGAWQRHPGARRDPEAGDRLDASFRWHDPCLVRPVEPCPRVHNTL
jgi:hypothetical protein